MAVRTKRLAAGTVTGGTDVLVYTCPAGETAILKDIRVYNPSGGAVSTFVYSDSGSALVLLFRASVPAGDSGGSEVWVVLHPGHTLRVASLSGQSNYWLSGTELDGVAS